MFWEKKTTNTINNFEDNSVKIQDLGINTRKQLVFPDGAKLSYINITEKNIYKILDKYESNLRVDTTGAKVNLKYNLGRRGIISKDSEATLIVGKINTFGLDFPYKMYYKNDECIAATYYYPMRNTEEIYITADKRVAKSYSAERKLTKLEEVYDNKIHTYQINPQTNNIECKVTVDEEEKIKPTMNYSSKLPEALLNMKPF